MRRNRPEIAVFLVLCLAALSQGAGAQTTAQGSDAMESLNLLFRWAHVLFGVLWIGHLYFFNFVQAGFEGKLVADVKKAVIPELRPRALYWFRWGAAWTWITGIFLLGIVYYMGSPTWTADKSMGYVAVLLIFVAYFVYDVMAKKLGAMTPQGIGACLVLLAAMIAVFALVGRMDGRAVFIHTGALLGTTMMMNVWMRIWPAQRQIIAAIKSGQPPDAALVGLAGARSRHNTYMSVPLLFLMVSNHYPSTYGGASPEAKHYAILAAVIAVGFATAKVLYQKASKVTGF
jgi:uncharacterized membrane protein